MFREVYVDACRDCRRSGASACGNDTVHREWSCLQCGSSESEPVVKRRHLIDNVGIPLDNSRNNRILS